MIDKNTLIEKLAELEHDQWVEWSKNLVEKETLSPNRVTRWSLYWVPYSQLPEKVKEQDRVWARKALNLISSFYPKKEQIIDEEDIELLCRE